MKKKDILELKKRFKKDKCTFTKMCGCYVNGEKNIILNFRETFLNLEEDEYFKYLEIAKKVLSGTLGNNILELNFPLDENHENEKQLSLMRLKKSQLKDDSLLEDFYKSIIDVYDYTGNFLILLFHDAYDVIKKTSDNNKIDESEEVYEYILCAVCPVSLSAPGLRYFEEENAIKSRIRDWVVDTPTLGFVFPAFIDRSSDVNSIMYYTKNTKDPHPEIMEETLGCYSKQTATIQKETFQTIIKDSINLDEKKANKAILKVQENLNNIIDEYNEIYDDTDKTPLQLTEKDIKKLLIDSDIPEEATSKIEKNYTEIFGNDLPLAEALIDSKALKERAQKKREEELEKKVEILEATLDEVKGQVNINDVSTSKEVILDDATDLNEILEDPEEEILNDNEVSLDNDKNLTHYDVILKVKPEKVPQIKSQIIDGQKCIVIPINEDEQTKVNDLDDLI